MSSSQTVFRGMNHNNSNASPALYWDIKGARDWLYDEFREYCTTEIPKGSSNEEIHKLCDEFWECVEIQQLEIDVRCRKKVTKELVLDFS